MRKILALVVALCLAPIGAQAWWQSVAQQSAGSAPSYQGPGDVFTTSPYAWYSCARVFTAAQANTSTSLCDLVDSAAPTVVICTLRGSSTGFVDLAGSYCTGSVTPSVKCAAATGGVCNVSQMYDLTGNGRHVTQATAASQPALTFSSTPSGTLPSVNCAVGATVLASGAVTQAQPLTFSAVALRNSTTTAGGIVGGASGAPYLAGGTTNNQVQINGGSSLTATASDASWHALNALANGNGTSSAINVDGSDATGAGGTTGLSALAIRLCRANSTGYNGRIAEAGIWAASSTSTDRGNLNTNQHSLLSGYNF